MVDALEFDLPPDRIAQHPARPRDASRLLVVHRATGALEDRRFSDLPDYFGAGDLLVLNETRVLPARLTGRRARGGRVEILLTRELEANRWEALVRPGRKVRAGDELRFDALQARVEDRLADGTRVLAFSGSRPLREELERDGSVPLPPYIRRPPSLADRRSYQTVYARKPGAVAAPTAGLHFTARTFRALRARGARLARICLHVGPGTFRPVGIDAEGRSGGALPPEPFEVSAFTVRALAETRRRGGRICCVGTTTTRTLETVAQRWPAGAGSGEREETKGLRGETALCIRPPFEFRLTDRLITNFHLPGSSPLLLVAAFAGTELLREAYRHAVDRGYRFYSYGDAMLVL